MTFNPFEKRATEYLRDDAAFLAVVTPEPLQTYLTKYARDGRLYDRMVRILGSPGCGKTTMARLFQHSTLQALTQHRPSDRLKPLIGSLTDCAALENFMPVVEGCRLPLEAEYRDIWELPYPDSLKTGLLTTLLQARAMIAWLRSLNSVSGQTFDIVALRGSEAAISAAGGLDWTLLLEKAQTVEEAVYSVTAALLPPKVDRLPQEAVAAYRPFDMIETFIVHSESGSREVKPLLILDDAHSLHPAQLGALMSWLMRRELRIARWVLMRFDALSSDDALECSDAGLKLSRDATTIRLQRAGETESKKEFRKMATDMANRYLAQMSNFSRRQLSALKDLLSEAPPRLDKKDFATLVRRVDEVQTDLRISAKVRTKIEESVDEYLASTKSGDIGDDVRLATISILLHRPGSKDKQLELFGGDWLEDVAEDSFRVNSALLDGARIHLLHHFNRPYFYGMNSLCDASTDNAEQFLQLASCLVSRLETQMIRKRQGGTILSARDQNDLLREKAREMISEWEFPEHLHVRRLTALMGERCLKRTLEPNAPLNGGATAMAIPMTEFHDLPRRYPDLARTLQFAVAYSALVIKRDYGQGKQSWALLELGGALRLIYGLTFASGGFIQSNADEISKLVGAH